MSSHHPQALKRPASLECHVRHCLREGGGDSLSYHWTQNSKGHFYKLGGSPVRTYSTCRARLPRICPSYGPSGHCQAQPIFPTGHRPAGRHHTPPPAAHAPATMPRSWPSAREGEVGRDPKSALPPEAERRWEDAPAGEAGKVCVTTEVVVGCGYELRAAECRPRKEGSDSSNPCRPRHCTR